MDNTIEKTGYIVLGIVWAYTIMDLINFIS